MKSNIFNSVKMPAVNQETDLSKTSTFFAEENGNEINQVTGRNNENNSNTNN
jgi:hypothetical protein